MKNLVMGIDLGGTFVKTAIVSQDKEIIAKASRPTNAENGPDAVIQTMADSARDLMQSAGVDPAQVCAVGMGCPGPLNWQTGIVYETPNMPGWIDIPLAAKMQAQLGIPAYLENDANAACYGEYWLGAGQGAQTMAVLTLGTGVGGGIVVFGKLLRGLDGTAAELGHLIVHRDGRTCGCDAKGCLEAYASVTGMVRTAVEGLEEGKESSLTTLCEGNHESITGKMIYQAAESGDKFAKWVFEETGTWLGLGCASLINALNPEKIVLCGGMIAAGDTLFEPIRRVAKANAFAVPTARCEIIPAALDNDAGVLGAAGCAFERHEMA
jgi:glucokinase